MRTATLLPPIPTRDRERGKTRERTTGEDDLVFPGPAGGYLDASPYAAKPPATAPSVIPKLRIMIRQAAHTPQHARSLFGLVLAGAILAALVPVSAAAGAEGRPPEIVTAGWGIGGQVTVNAQINPEGLETSYEVKLACSSCAPVGYSPATGTLPAVNEPRIVTLSLTGIAPGSYRFDVLAHNSAGEANWPGEFTVPEVPPGACPDGCPASKNEENTAEVPQWYNHLSDEESNKTLKEYEAKQAKEHEETKAREAAQLAAEAAELEQAEQREAQEAAARERSEREEAEAEHPACRVPALKGDTLVAARRALAKAHCRLGVLHQPADHHGTLRVSAQGAPAGELLAHGARVALWIGAKGSGAKRASHRG